MGSWSRKNIEPEALRKALHEDHLTLREAAKLFNCSASLIRQKQAKYGLTRKNGSERGEHIRSLNKRLRNPQSARKDAYGYWQVRVDGHPNRNHSGFVPFHRRIIELAIGQLLPKGSAVHHINFCKHDNRIENLVLFWNDCDHHRYHHYLSRVGAFVIGAADPPEPMRFEKPIYFGGKWISEIDHIGPLVDYRPVAKSDIFPTAVNGLWEMRLIQ